MRPLRQFLYWSLPSSILLQLLLLHVVTATSSSPILCSDGFGGQQKRVIPAERINDGYCDCPADGGIDELGTDACSGSMDWSGVTLFTDSGSDTPPKQFQCAQQPNLQIPLSHVSDGICDCCDGSDEQQSQTQPQSQTIQCPDNCAAQFEAERLAKADLIERYTNGSAKRAEHQTLYHTFTQSTIDEIGVLTEATIPKWREELKDVEEDIYSARLKSIRHRFELVREVLEDFLFLMGGGSVPGNVGQLEQFIVAGCRLAGEITILDGGDGSGSDVERTITTSTCMPLKLSGMDLGFVWEEDGEVRRGGWEDEVLAVEIAGRWMEYVDGSGGGDGSDSGSSSEKVTDDEDEDDYKEDYEEDYDDDFPMDPIDDDDDIRPKRVQKKKPPKLPPQEHAIESNVTVASTSPFRYHFHHRAKELISKIDELLSLKDDTADKNDNNDITDNYDKDDYDDDDDDAEDGDDDDDDDDDYGNDDKSEILGIEKEVVPDFDPMALNMVRNFLSRRVQSIERGADYAASARSLLKSLQEQTTSSSDDTGTTTYAQDLLNLAIGIIYHAKLGAADVVEIIQLYDIELPSSDNSCISLYTTLCPVVPNEIATVHGDILTYPGKELIQYAVDRCIERRDDDTTSCDLNNDDTTDGIVSIDAIDIPSTIPDGYYSYYTPKARDSEDFYTSRFEKLGNAEYGNNDELDHYSNVLEDKKNNLQNEISKSEAKLRNLRSKFGQGDDGSSKYGPEGELYVMRDDCFSITSGKYTYEVCIFGKAYQREETQSKGGTDLGQWSKMEIDEATGDYVLRWTGGAKCWNGPKRSATVIATCGAETKLLSADEPNICEYEFRMESSIACDKAFGERNQM